jgi:hypothetical protein
MRSINLSLPDGTAIGQVVEMGIKIKIVLVLETHVMAIENSFGGTFAEVEADPEVVAPDVALGDVVLVEWDQASGKVYSVKKLSPSARPPSPPERR